MKFHCEIPLELSSSRSYLTNLAQLLALMKKGEFNLGYVYRNIFEITVICEPSPHGIEDSEYIAGLKCHVLFVCSGLTSLSTIFQSYHDDDRELNAHFYSAASLKYHAPDS